MKIKEASEALFERLFELSFQLDDRELIRIENLFNKLLAVAKAAKAYVDAPDGSVTFEHQAIVQALEDLEEEV